MGHDPVQVERFEDGFGRDGGSWYRSGPTGEPVDELNDEFIATAWGKRPNDVAMNVDETFGRSWEGGGKSIPSTPELIMFSLLTCRFN